MASGDSLLQWVPGLSMEPPASAYATFDVRNSHPVVDFDQSTDESIWLSGVMPQHYDGGGVTVYLHWGATGITSGNVIWNTAFERVSDSQQDIDADGPATAQASAATAVPATDGHVKITTIAHTDGAQMDSVAAGEGFRLKITRDANDAGDTAAADAELRWVEIRET